MSVGDDMIRSMQYEQDDSPQVRSEPSIGWQLDGCDDLEMGSDDDMTFSQIDGIDDSILDEIDESETEPVIEDTNKQNCTPINVINTNARSLCPKINSLIDCFEELDVTVGIVTETWLADGDSLDKDVRDLAVGAGLDMICLNRQPSERGVAHGGVAILSNNSLCTLKRVEVPNPEGFEVLVTISTLPLSIQEDYLPWDAIFRPTIRCPGVGRPWITSKTSSGTSRGPTETHLSSWAAISISGQWMRRCPTSLIFARLM